MSRSSSTAVSHEFQLPTHKLHYLTWGCAGKPRIVLVHGGLDNGQTWEELAVHLAREWHVFAIDLRGHGDSDWSSTGDYHPASYLGDIAQFLKEVVGMPARVVGHSMGARLALQLMGCMPEAVSSLVAIEGLGAEEPPSGQDLDPNMRKWLSDRVGRAARDDVVQLGNWLRERIAAGRQHKAHTDLEGPIARQLADGKKKLTRQQATTFVESNMRLDGDEWVWKFDPLARWQASHELVQSQLPFWKAIRGPVLHIYGSESWAYPPTAEKLDAFRNGHMATIPDAGHWVHLNNPGEVASRIASFFGFSDAMSVGGSH